MAVGDREMTSFSPLTFYTFAAARGEFLRPDVRALLAGASVGPFSRVTILHDRMLQSVPDPKFAGIPERFDAVFFPVSLPPEPQISRYPRETIPAAKLPLNLR